MAGISLAGPTQTKFVASALLERSGSYLFIKQVKPGGAYPGTLHIPGGGIEPGETPLEAVRREVREEVGLDIEGFEPVDFSWDTLNYKGEPTVLVFFRFSGVVPDGAEPSASSDAKEIVWIAKGDLMSSPHNPATLSLLAALGLM